MGKMGKTSCEILFEKNPNRVYYGGDLVKGNVIITLHKEKIIKGIYITIVGNAECLWTENSGDKRMAYRGKECYLSTRIYFIGKEDGEPITLNPDVYKYEFACQLPEDLPTSMEGTFGHIRYAAIVTINVPIWPDKVYRSGFTVVRAVNLNEMFELRDSVSVEKRKEFYICCLLFCFKTLPLNITAKLPSTGYTAGQLIDLTLVADNQSSKNVRNFKVEFFKIIIYKSNQMSSQRKAEKIRLYEFSPGGCAKGREVEYSIGIVVPSVPPTDLTASSVCRVKYEILITAEVNCCHNSPELIIPITIGSIPFVDNYHRIKRRPTISTLDERSKRTKPMPAELLADNTPKYVEAFGVPETKDDKQETIHIPAYPTFKN